ncbi:hypothetical protein D3C73_1587120 [compost metagenome]
MDVGQRRKAKHQRFHRSRQSRQRGRQHEGHQLEAVCTVAQRDGATLVLLDRLEELAKRGTDYAGNQHHRCDKDGDNDIVEADIR